MTIYEILKSSGAHSIENPVHTKDICGILKTDARTVIKKAFDEKMAGLPIASTRKNGGGYFILSTLDDMRRVKHTVLSEMANSYKYLPVIDRLIDEEMVRAAGAVNLFQDGNKDE